MATHSFLIPHASRSFLNQFIQQNVPATPKSCTLRNLQHTFTANDFWYDELLIRIDTLHYCLLRFWHRKHGELLEVRLVCSIHITKLTIEDRSISRVAEWLKDCKHFKNPSRTLGHDAHRKQRQVPELPLS